MRKIGLLGGMGPESTLVYYRLLIDGVGEKLGRGVIPQLTIESIDPEVMHAYCAKGDYDGLTDFFVKLTDNLAACGCEAAAMTANTAHVVFDRVKARAALPMVSIVETACGEAQRRGYKTLGLMGTLVTMRGAFYREPFERAGIRVVLPTEEEMQLVSQRIAQELEFGVVKEETVRELCAVIARMKEEEDIDAVILGCTELPLALNDTVSPVPCLDTLRVHADALTALITEAEKA